MRRAGASGTSSRVRRSPCAYALQLLPLDSWLHLVRRRLVKFGLGEDEVKIMSDENVRVLVQRPTVIKKMLAKRAAK